MKNKSSADVIIEAIESGEAVTVSDNAPIGTQIDHELTPEQAKEAIQDKLGDKPANTVACLFGNEIH